MDVIICFPYRRSALKQSQSEIHFHFFPLPRLSFLRLCLMLIGEQGITVKLSITAGYLSLLVEKIFCHYRSMRFQCKMSGLNYAPPAKEIACLLLRLNGKWFLSMSWWFVAIKNARLCKYTIHKKVKNIEYIR